MRRNTYRKCPAPTSAPATVKGCRRIDITLEATQRRGLRVFDIHGHRDADGNDPTVQFTESDRREIIRLALLALTGETPSDNT